MTTLEHESATRLQAMSIAQGCSTTSITCIHAIAPSQEVALTFIGRYTNLSIAGRCGHVNLQPQKDRRTTKCTDVASKVIFNDGPIHRNMGDFRTFGLMCNDE